MKRFEAPKMVIQKLAAEDILTASDCRVEALGCISCYCSAVVCDPYDCTSNQCNTDYDF